MDTHQPHWELCSHLERADYKILSSLFKLSIGHICTSTNAFQSPLIYFKLILTDISNCQVLNHHFTLIFNMRYGTICHNQLPSLVNLIKNSCHLLVPFCERLLLAREYKQEEGRGRRRRNVGFLLKKFINSGAFFFSKQHIIEDILKA